MGDVISFAYGPTAYPGTDVIITYTHPRHARPSRVGLIAAHLSSGTQTGKVCIRYGQGDLASVPEIHKDVFTAAAPSVAIDPGVVIQPGQSIYVWIWDVTAGDDVRVFIEGH